MILNEGLCLSHEGLDTDLFKQKNNKLCKSEIKNERREKNVLTDKKKIGIILQVRLCISMDL